MKGGLHQDLEMCIELEHIFFPVQWKYVHFFICK